MGYKIGSLTRLPLDDRVQIYVFSVGDSIWEGGLADLVSRNFDKLAEAIGENAILVEPLPGASEMHGAIVETYLGNNHAVLKNVLPAILVTDAHPNELKPDSARYLFPLKEAHSRYGDIDNFLQDLVSFVRGESTYLLEAFEKAPDVVEIADKLINFRVPIIPGWISINGNHVIRKMRTWASSRKKSQV